MPIHKTGILVAGMHRSGTSAVARLLNILGAAVPGNLMPPHAQINAKGFWESIDIASLNDELLRRHRSRWDDVLSIPLDDPNQETWQDFELRATELLDRDFLDAKLFVLKDPRICRLLPHWIKVFEHLSIQPRVVIPIRHPLEVSASLKKRDGFPEEKSIYLWLRHIIDTERASRNVPRAFVLYDDLLEDWQSTSVRIAAELGLIWPKPYDTARNEVEIFLDTQLRHHRRQLDQLADGGTVARECRELYLALQRNEPDISSLIDRIHASIAPAEEILTPVLQDVHRQLQLGEFSLAETKAWGSELDTALQEAQQNFNHLREEFDQKCRHVDLLMEETAQLKSALSVAKNALAQRTVELTERSTELHDSHQKLAEANASLLSERSLMYSAAGRLGEANAAIQALASTQGLHARRAPLWKTNKDLRLLEETTLFDVAFYLSAYPDVLLSKMTPQEHYLRFGAREGRDPHPLFSTNWYLEKNRDVAQRGMNPLLHFLRYGAKEGRSPHPLFDMQLYKEAYPEVASSGMNLLEHYLLFGGQAGFRPHWLFDGRTYLENYAEVREMGINPLQHYLQFGYLKNYRPHWAFDPIYYLMKNPEVANSGVPALVHFITRGARQRLNPNAEFDTASFLEQYPFLEGSNDNPLSYHVRNLDHQAVFTPPPQTHHTLLAPATVPDTPIHNMKPGQPLPAFMDLLFDEFGEDVRFDIVNRMQRFHLPFTSEKIVPNPTEREVEIWIDEIASLSNAVPEVAQPDVSIVVPVYNQLPFTLACIHSVLSSATKYSFEIIVADDRSTDRTTELFSKGVGKIRHVITPENRGFIRNCNNAAKHAKGRYLVLLNNDTIVMPGWLDELIAPLESDPVIGLTGSKLLYPDGRLQEAGGIIFNDGSGWNYGRADDPRKPQYCYMRDADYISGASIALRSDFWNAQGGFDEHYSVAYYEDTDMAFRVRQAGLRVVVQPLSQLLHFEGISSGTDTSSGAKQYQVSNAVLFKEKWSGVLSGHGKCDPAHLPADRTSIGRILVIDACTPTPDRDAGSLDAFQHFRILKSLGLHVTFAPENLAHFGHYTRDLQRIGIETLYAPYCMSFEELLTKSGKSYDLVLIYRAPVAKRLLDLVRTHAPQAKIILETVDLHFLREEREAALTHDPEKVKSAAATRKSELSVIERSDASIVLSNHEMDILRPLVPKARLYEIPLVREIPGRGTLGFVERKDIVFIGGFRHTPNLDAVKWFVSEVWPLLRAKGFSANFQIVGADMPPEITSLHGNGIVIRGHVPDITDVFQSIRISIAPLRFGAGLKGKVISSMCYGIPVVATSIAAEGAGFEHEENLLVADKPAAMADAIIRLYDDSELWEKLSQAGLQLCNESFSVAVVSAHFRRLISDIASELPLWRDSNRTD